MFSLNINVYGANSDKDSVKKVFPPVKVTADLRAESDVGSKYSAVTYIDKKEIQQIGTRQVSDAVLFSPGVIIKNYGGLGGIKTVSMRGTTSQQTLVTLDGLRLNSHQNGSFDFTSIPMTLVKEIEVIRGGSSAAFGGNAIGGVINLKTFDRQDSSHCIR